MRAGIATKVFIALACFSVTLVLPQFLFAQAPASPNQCLDSQLVNRLVQDYRIGFEVDTGNGQAAPVINPCDEKSLPYKVLKAIQLLEELPNLESRADAFDSAARTEAPAAYFKKRVRRILISHEFSEDCENGRTLASADVKTSTMRVCPFLVNATVFFIAETLIHEARHMDGDAYMHVPCTRGPNAGNGVYMCDPSFEHRGSYGMGAEFSVRVSRTPQVSQSMRHEARIAALVALVENFNSDRLGIRPGVALQTKDNDVLFFDGAHTEPMFRMPKASDRLAMNGTFPAVYSPDDGAVRAYVAGPNFARVEAEFPILFGTKLSKSERSGFIDTGIYKGIACFLTARNLHCRKRERYSVTPVGSLQPVGLLKVGDRLAIASRNGFAYAVPGDLLGTKDFDAKRFTMSFDRWDLKDLIPLGQNNFVGLDLEGRAVSLPAANARSTEIPALNSRRYKKAIGPLLWSRQLEAL